MNIVFTIFIGVALIWTIICFFWETAKINPIYSLKGSNDTKGKVINFIINLLLPFVFIALFALFGSIIGLPK